ncbi:MAG TPA: MASE1 domain-containing protein [Gaiellales bacterium]|nr:MASE1 domain-containing protein [Gaiellales bacterium]
MTWRSLGDRRYLLAIVVTAAAYYVAARIGLHLAYPHSGTSTYGAVTAFWPPVGVGIAALVLFGPRLWPAVVIGDLLAGDYSTPLGVTLGQTLGTTAGIVLAAVLLIRLGAREPGLRVRDVLVLIACAAAGTAIGAAIGVLALWIAGELPAVGAERVWRTWWLSNLAGALVVSPAILTWATGRVRMTRNQVLEGAALIVVLLGLTDLASQHDVPYVIFPALIWASLRFGPRGAAAALLAASVLTIWDTSSGTGPFVRSSLTDSLLATQLFVAVAALTSMILAAVTAERAATAAAARGLAREQAALRRIATLVVSEADPARVFGQVMHETALALGVATATIVRYDAPGTVSVLGGWSQSGSLLFPVGSTIEISDEVSALVEVYRTGEARRVTYPEGASGLVDDLRQHGYRSSVAAPVKLASGLWGALVASSIDEGTLPAGSEQRLSDFADLVAQALANADAHDRLAASRARIVGAGDAERRRLERNLHDGAQQRLVSLALQLRLTQSALERRPEAVAGLLQEAQAELARALDELRELARGIHPAILTDRGLGPALEAILARAPLPVELTDLPAERLPEPVEAAVYYVVAETVTNIAKHAQAESATVSVTLSGTSAHVVITDNGVGGADPAGGSGLRGLADRIEALDGGLRIESDAAFGTRIEAQIPCE